MDETQPNPILSASTWTDRKFLIFAIALSVFAAAIPFLIGLLSAPSPGSYLGVQFGTDDHMVYAAWMRQAIDGRVLMDNRFTTDSQPGLTIHAYFFVLGVIAKVTGIPMASAIGRFLFTGIFVFLSFRMTRRLGWSDQTARLGTVLSVVGGGLGFMVWHTYGVAIVSPAPPVLSDLLGGLLPTDVWQPEGFVFPSMLVNGLFMVSLCLILFAFECLIEARKSWSPVLPGALALAVLMNIHSYDVLLVTLVMVGFLAASIVTKQITRDWILRAAAIGSGAILPAIWFVHVLRSDTVFQARAHTDTPSANFRAVLFGYILMMILALVGLALRPSEGTQQRNKQLGGVGLASVLILGLFMVGSASKTPYMLDTASWIFATVVALAATALLASENPWLNLLISWALVGTVAVYFPGQFQRKLTMGLSIPWAILAAYGLNLLLSKQEKSIRTLGTALALIVLGASSIRWLGRELQLLKQNASNTSVQTVFLDADSLKIVDFLNALRGRHVVIAPPGIPSPAFAAKTQESGESAITPTLPDLNPIVSGLAGVYTFAGHWSETPDYNKRRKTVSSIYFGKGSQDAKAELIKETGADYMIAIEPKSLPAVPLPDAASFGEVVIKGQKFSLVKIKSN